MNKRRYKYAVVVTYNPPSFFGENLKQLINQFDQVIIVDNCSNIAEFDLKMVDPMGNVEIIYLSENKGIATAINQGIRFIESKNISDGWLFLFDQDSKVTPTYAKDLIENYLQSMKVFPQVKAIHPTYFEINTQRQIRFNSDTVDYALVDYSMTSGALFDISIFKDIGYFRNDYFIDYVDIEFGLRMRKFGFAVVETHRVVLPHRLGNSKIVNMFGILRTTTNHSAVRRYYRSRNRVITYKLYFKNFSWLFRDIIGFFAEFITMMFFENDRLEKLRLTMAGVMHGFLGKTGKINER